MAKIGLSMSIDIPARLTAGGSVFSSTTFQRKSIKFRAESEVLGSEDDVIVARGSDVPERKETALKNFDNNIK